MPEIVGGPVRVPVQADLQGFDQPLSAAQQQLRQLAPSADAARVAVGQLEKTIGEGATSAAAATAALQRSGQAAVRLGGNASDAAQQQGRLSFQIRETDQALQRLARAYANDPTDASRARIERLTGAYLDQRAALRESQRGLDAQTRASSQATNVSFILANTLQDVNAAGGDLQNVARFAGNNILQLTQVMGQMAAQSRAAGTTLTGTLVRGLSGPAGLVAGIGLAVGILPTLISLLDRSQDSFTGSGKAARDAADAYRDAVDAAVDLTVANDAALKAISDRLAIEQQIGGLGPARTLEEIFGTGTPTEDPFAALREGASAAAPAFDRLTTAADGTANAGLRGAEATGAQAQAIRALQAAIEDETSARERNNAVEALRLQLGIKSREEAERASRVRRGEGRGPTPRGTEVVEVSEIDRIGQALATARREADGLASLGEITALQVAQRDADAILNAIRTTLRLAEGTDGRETTLLNLDADLNAARRLQAILQGGLNDVTQRDAVLPGLSDTVEAAGELAETLQDVQVPRSTVADLSAVQRFLEANAQAAQRLVETLGEGLAGGLLDVAFFGAEAARSLELAGFEAERTREQLAEMYASGEIGSREYELRLAEVDASLSRLRSQAPTIGNALKRAFREAGEELARLLIRAAAVRAALALLNVVAPGSSALLGAGGSLFSTSREATPDEPVRAFAAPVAAARPALPSPRVAQTFAGTVSTVAGAARINAGRQTLEIPLVQIVESMAAGQNAYAVSGLGSPFAGGVVTSG